MTRRSKLEGVSVGELAGLVNEEGQLGAALELGVSQSAVSQYLRKHGYQAVTVYLKDGETVTITPEGASVPFQMADGQS